VPKYSTHIVFEQCILLSGTCRGIRKECRDDTTQPGGFVRGTFRRYGHVIFKVSCVENEYGHSEASLNCKVPEYRGSHLFNYPIEEHCTNSHVNWQCKIHELDFNSILSSNVML
jgi:hypothetical protein